MVRTCHFLLAISTVVSAQEFLQVTKTPTAESLQVANDLQRDAANAVQDFVGIANADSQDADGIAATNEAPPRATHEHSMADVFSALHGVAPSLLKTKTTVATNATAVVAGNLSMPGDGQTMAEVFSGFGDVAIPKAQPSADNVNSVAVARDGTESDDDEEEVETMADVYSALHHDGATPVKTEKKVTVTAAPQTMADVFSALNGPPAKAESEDAPETAKSSDEDEESEADEIADMMSDATLLGTATPRAISPRAKQARAAFIQGGGNDMWWADEANDEVTRTDTAAEGGDLSEQDASEQSEEDDMADQIAESLDSDHVAVEDAAEDDENDDLMREMRWSSGGQDEGPGDSA